MQIGQYQIERQLGRGGFGVVYIGVDVRLGRRAAIKQLLPELSNNREIVERFFNEAKAAANINHPGIVEIYDVGWHTDGSAYFAMKLLDGDSLSRRLRSGPVSIVYAATVGRQVASALVAAHNSGIVHRDLKPDNIILVPDDEVAIGERAVILDFGIAKLSDPQSMSNTRSGMMMGTPGYMSPEQCRGAGEVDHRTDLYALGCILFEMLTGRPPFVGEGPGEVMGMHQFVEPPALRSLRPDVPPDLDALIAKLLAKKIDQRMQRMSEVQSALQAFATGGRSMERPAAAPSTVNALAPTQVSEREQPAPQPDPVSAAAQQANQPLQPTTYTSASGEVAKPAQAAKKRLAIGIGAVALIGIGIAIAVGAGGDRPATTAVAAAVATPADAAVVAVADAAVADAQTKSEAAAELAASDMTAAALNNNADGVYDAFARIPSDSSYRAKARALFDQFGRQLVEATVKELQALATAGNCKQFDARIAKLREQSKKRARTAHHYDEMLERTKSITCRAPSVGSTTTRVRCTDAEALAKLEKSAFASQAQGNFRAAVANFETVLSCNPAPPRRAALLMGGAYASACRAQLFDKAKVWFRKLGKPGLAQLCLREGFDPRK